MRENMKNFFLCIIYLAGLSWILSTCSSSGRTGVGPYDVTDYSSLEARQEMLEAQYEMTKYPIDDYYDMLAEQEATRMAEDAISDYLYELYLQERESGEY